MTAKKPTLTASATASGVTLIDEQAAALALINYSRSVTDCAFSGHAPSNPEVPVTIRDFSGKMRNSSVRPSGQITVTVQPHGTEIVLDVIEYGDPHKRLNPHKRGCVIVFSKRPLYEPGPYDHGE